MKNSSKNNFSGKNSRKYKKNPDSNFSSKNTDSPKNNNKFLTNNSENRRASNLNESDKRKSNFSSLKKTNSITKPNLKFSKKDPYIKDEFVNKRNFDDWIWGKHSVFEALTSKRAINRVWCTSEIFSSEKFYIALKDLKSNGVLIEEVSWNRISQLTYGASHQGGALQMATSKTIALNKLID